MGLKMKSLKKDYVLCIADNEKHLVQIAFYKTQIDDLDKKIKEEREKIKAPTLKELKKKYLPPQ